MLAQRLISGYGMSSQRGPACHHRKEKHAALGAGRPVQRDLSNEDIRWVSDVVRGGPIQRGFYVVSGAERLTSLLLNQLVEVLQWESLRNGAEERADSEARGEDAEGEMGVPGSLHTEIGRLLWVDSGNSFEPYYLARLAAEKGLNPIRVLRAFEVARPFTAYQFQQILDKVPNPIFETRKWRVEHQGGQKPGADGLGMDSPVRSAPVWRVPLVILSDLMKLFFDPELPERDLERAFRFFLSRLEALKKKAVVVGLLIHRPAPKGREHLVSSVLGAANRLLSSRMTTSFLTETQPDLCPHPVLLPLSREKEPAFLINSLF